MTPTEEAKLRVAAVFAALQAYPLDAQWRELVRGGFAATGHITGGTLEARVDGGAYAVYACKGDKRLVTLISGTFEQGYSPSEKSVGNTPEVNKEP